ncbi:MAG: LLM class F420-dependent oxidoreductase [Candidatus Dormibacteraeota bacterium]|nr:LLM class F420-dependent oxidoreductase [Candidatus Dormibacteraeota bacterium]
MPYSGRMPIPTLRRLVEAADRLGYDTVWAPEVYGADAFTVLTDLGARTRQIRLGTGIANIFARTPAMLAQSAASLDLLSEGRVVLGLGTSGHQVVEGWHGQPFGHSLRRLRETIEIVRLILRRDRLQYEGEVFQLTGGLRLILHPLRAAVPIYLASVTPGGLELTGELADGWLPIFVSPRHLEATFRPSLEKGAARVGRNLDDLQVCAYQQVVVDDDLARARDVARPHLALYIGGMGSRRKNYYNQLFCRYGFEAEARRIQDLYLDGHRKEAMAAIPDALVDLVTVCGPLDRCREQLRERAAAGIDELALGLEVPGADETGALAALQGLRPELVSG